MAGCLVGYENWTVKKIPMRNIAEEAADVWTKPSAKITDLVEQFKKESAFYVEKMNHWYCSASYDEGEAFKSRQIAKIARIYSEMHPESNSSHVHAYKKPLESYRFLVHT
ncbi:unnamed protein product [Gongylonema pulchrum]|uniref:Transposase n=1 Tax=Gongylonema pulchrum TaxID=637853 RepID=A0A183CVY0_9BILA|nr:unnamed protein product [Gongylonema pulchrum]